MDAGTARVVVEADTGLADAAFKKLQADAARAMDAIGRSKAEAEVTAKTTDFDRKIDNAKRKIDELSKAKAHPSADFDAGKADAQIDKLEAKIKALSAQRATIRVDAKELRDANKQMDLSAKKQAQMSKNYLSEQKAIESASKARTKAAQQAENDTRKLAAMQDSAARDDARRTDESLRNVERLAKARRDYGKVLGEVQRLENKTGRPGGIFRTAGETRDLDVAKTKVEALGREIERLGGDFEDINPDLERSQGLIGRWGSSLSKTRVQLGLFSATTGQIGKALVGLGPILTGLAGSLVSVVGVLGAGLAGATAVGAAGLSGFIGAAVGVGAVVVPMIKQFKEAHKASENLAKAQKEYGKGSTQAKTAQEKFNHILAGTSPAAKAAVKDYGDITSEWKSLTAAAKPAVFNAFASGIQTVQALLPGFAKQSVATTKVAGSAWEGWMKSLRSPESKQLLNTVLSNFRASIPGVADGLASLAAAFGRITAAASKSLPSLSKGFADWANKVEDGVGQGDSLDKKVHSLITDMQDLGHLTSDTGSLLLHIFGSSSKSGDDLVNSLDRVVQKWNAWTQSTEGKQSLGNFFDEARAETEQFFAALAPLTQLLFSMSRAFAPITSGALDVVQAIGSVVQELSKLPELKTGLEGVGAVLAGMWAVGKVKGFATALSGAAQAIGGLLGFRGGAKGAASLERTGEAIIGVSSASAGAEASVGGFSALLAPEILVPAAAVGALVYLATTLEGPKSGFQEAGEAAQEFHQKFNDSTNAFVKGGIKYAATARKELTINQEATAARKAFTKAQEKHGAVSKQAIAAQEKLAQIESHQVATEYKAGQQRTASVQQARAIVASKKEEIHADEQRIHAAKAANQSIANGTADNNTAFGNPHEAEQVAFAVHKLTNARSEAAAAAARMVVANIPLMRQQKELPALTQASVQGLQHLSQTIGSAATKKIGGFVNPHDVQEITKLGNKLAGLGRGSQVKSIAVKSQGADQTIAKLNKLQKQTQKVEGARASVHVDANDTGAQRTLKAVSRESQRLAGTKATLHILGNADNAEQAISRLLSHLHQVLATNYKAELKAEDKSGAAASAFHHNLQRASTGKYEAKLTAVNRAANIASSAEDQAKKFGNGHYEAHLTAVNQAQPIIQAAIAELQSYNGKTATSTITTRHVTVNETRGGKYMGGASSYTSAFAIGGVSDTQSQRAAERAVTREGGTGGVIRQPTMLTGEQAPTYNEFVITENPAYRMNNERYLEQAAGSLGRELIPAFKGGGKSSSKSGGSKPKKDAGPQVSDGGIKDPGPPPKFNKEVRKYREPTEVNNGSGIGQFNSLTKDASIEETAFQNELQKEEREIAVYKKTGQGRQAWDFKLFRRIRESILTDDKKIKSEAIPQEIKDVFEVQKKASGVWGTANGEWETAKGKLETGHKRLAKMKNSYNHMQRSKHESEKEYSDKRLKFKGEIEAQEAENDKWKERKKALEDRKKEARKTELAAKKEIRELKGAAQREAGNSVDEQENSLAELTDYETGALETPYAETEEVKTPAEIAQEKKEEVESVESNEREGLEAKIVEQELGGPSHTQQLKEARENLLSWDEGALGRARLTPENSDDLNDLQNIKSDKEALEGDAAGGTAKSIGEETASLNSARENLFQQFASNITAGAALGAGATGTTLGQLLAGRTVGGGFFSGSPSAAAASSGSTAGGGSGTVNNVTNNFSTPPPDPHTFTKNLLFELNAA